MDEITQPDLRDVPIEAVLAALGDPTRLDIVRKLLVESELACGSICDQSPKSTASHHFRVLREAGITRTRTQGTQRLVSIRKEELEARFPGLLKLLG